MSHQLFHIFGLQEGGNRDAGFDGKKPHRVLWVHFLAFAPENVRGLTFTAPNSETGYNRYQKAERQEYCRYSTQIYKDINCTVEESCVVLFQTDKYNIQIEQVENKSYIMFLHVSLNITIIKV